MEVVPKSDMAMAPFFQVPCCGEVKTQPRWQHQGQLLRIGGWAHPQHAWRTGVCCGASAQFGNHFSMGRQPCLQKHIRILTS